MVDNGIDFHLLQIFQACIENFCAAGNLVKISTLRTEGIVFYAFKITVVIKNSLIVVLFLSFKIPSFSCHI